MNNNKNEDILVDERVVIVAIWARSDVKVDTLSKISQFDTLEISQFRHREAFFYYIYLFVFIPTQPFHIQNNISEAPCCSTAAFWQPSEKKAISVNKESKGIEFEEIAFDWSVQWDLE